MKDEAVKGTNSRSKGIEINIALAVFDILIGNIAYAVALWLRFDMRYTTIPEQYIDTWLYMIPVQGVIVFLIFTAFRLYRSIWKYASIDEVQHIAAATTLSCLLYVAATKTFFVRMPVGFYLMGGLLEFFAFAAMRYSYRFFKGLETRWLRHMGYQENVMIIGAGDAARLLIKELKSTSKISVKVCCVIDDDERKRGKLLNGVPVVGNREEILKNVEKYNIQRIIFAIPSIKASQRRDILNICKESDCRLQTLPGVYQLVNDEVTINNLRNVSVEELLGREIATVETEAILETVKGKVILVTGGGGSIGSELCRQLAEHQPKQLIIFDVYENNAYDIQQELNQKYPQLDLQVAIGSVQDERRVEQIFALYQPEIVYHAAAHKHVPLMEFSPNEAIKNNVWGTYQVAMAADRHQTKRFILISTDKAVNPTNIMGASKRMCEMVIQAINKRSATEYVAVRFGNVLGSNGSVIPLFRKQIENGGPVTVTHPDIIRYFMTIQEAVSLVLQAGVYAQGGEIFVLDMGEPVKIDDLARNLIRLSGYIPEEDIPIVYTGLRRGEKMYEECLRKDEGLQRTENQLIFIGKPITFNDELFLAELPKLREACYNNSDNIQELVKKFVPSYCTQTS